MAFAVSRFSSLSGNLRFQKVFDPASPFGRVFYFSVDSQVFKTASASSTPCFARLENSCTLT